MDLDFCIRLLFCNLCTHIVSTWAVSMKLWNCECMLDRVRLSLLSVGTKNARSPDPGRSINAKYLQTVQNVTKLPCLCFFLLDTLYKRLRVVGANWGRVQIYARKIVNA